MNMTPLAPALLLAILSFFSAVRAQERAPHGLANESPMAFSPSAFEFFHPDTQQSGTKSLCAASNCSPLPIAATVQSTLAHESRSTPEASGSRMGAGGIAGVVFGFVLAVALAMGIYNVVITRRANLNRTRSNSVQLDV